MTLAMGLILLGFILIYGGIKGLSIRRLMLGDNSTASTTPEPRAR